MSSPTYEFTTLKKLIARTKVRLKIEHLNTDDLFIKDCIVEAASIMGTEQDFIQKTATLEITSDFTALLPFDFFEFNRGNTENPPLVFTQNGEVLNTISTGYTSAVFTDSPFVTSSPFTANPIDIASLNIQNGVIYFSNNINATECKISYLAVNYDENGDIKIPQNNSRAIMNYAMSEWGLANGLPNGQVAEYRKIWTQGKLEQRGRSKLLDTFKRERMYRIMNSI